MGRCHANAFRAVGGIFDLSHRIRLEMLADASDSLARRNAGQLGFRRSTGRWPELVRDPAIDIVAITAPNILHEPIALDAIANGKTVYCEKPLATDGQAALRMTQAAESAGITTVVGFNFLSNPLMQFARDLIAAGDIGEVTGFRGRHAENYMASPDAPHTFRTDPAGGGALADLGSHVISLARHLVGPIAEVNGNLVTIHKVRPITAGSAVRRPVEVDDAAYALVRFENGAVGTVEANWAATGRTMDLSFEITGQRGSIRFSQERLNELLLWFQGSRKGRSGYVKVEAGPEHPPYGLFCPATGHQLGFNDLKVIEVARLAEAMTAGTATYPDFREALAIQRTVDAIRESSMLGKWVKVHRDL